jgi:hypothetical protein
MTHHVDTQAAADPERWRRLAAFVLGGPRAGKSTAAAILGRLLGSDVIETSTVIAASLERARGLGPGSLIADREAEPELHRGELGRWGTEMARRNGWSPARIGVARGYRVVSGCRRLGELIAAEREAVRRGLEPWPIWVDRAGIIIHDNTDAALRRHAGAAGSIVSNDGDLEALAAALVRALEDRTSGVGTRL